MQLKVYYSDKIMSSLIIFETSSGVYFFICLFSACNFLDLSRIAFNTDIVTDILKLFSNYYI